MSGLYEKLIDAWFDSTNERKLQAPFCHLLTVQGYQVIHSTRHCAMEMGKDVIARDQHGRLHAFQLKSNKGRRLTMAKYRADVQAQLTDLVYGSIVHPSVPEGEPHVPWLIVNGTLDEEVARSIDDFNRSVASRLGNERRVRTKLAGELKTEFLALGNQSWPTEPQSAKDLLEIALIGGRSPFPKERLFSAIGRSLFIEPDQEKPSEDDYCSALSSSAILCSTALGSFLEEENYWAEVEAWTVLAISSVAGAVRWNIANSKWRPQVALFTAEAMNALGRLCDELSNRTHLAEEPILADTYVYGFRITQLVGAMSAYGLLLEKRETLSQDLESHYNFSRDFCNDHWKDMYFWGEGAFPCFLLYYAFACKSQGSMKADILLSRIATAITTQNGPRSHGGLASPYYDGEAVMLGMLGQNKDLARDSFVGSSYVLESVLALLVRENWMQMVKQNWASYTRMVLLEFEPEAQYQRLLWRSTEGSLLARRPRHRDQWVRLMESYCSDSTRRLPSRLANIQDLLILYFLIYPHRIATAPVCQFMDLIGLPGWISRSRSR